MQQTQQTQQRRVYLDKLVTEPHVPKLEGQKGYNSTKTLPDLSHTGIQTKFQPKDLVVVDLKKGNLTRQYKEHTYNRMMTIEREYIAAHSVEKTFKAGHKQFIDKLMVELESETKRKHKTLHKSWKSDKDQLGFTDAFQFYPDSPPASPDQQQAPNSDYKPLFSGGQNQRDQQNQQQQPEYIVDFDTDGVNPELTVAQVDAIGQIIESWPRGSSNSSSSSSRSRSSHNGTALQQPSSSSRKKKSTEPRGWTSSAANKVRVFNRMSMFESLLQVTHAPQSRTGDRYGALKSLAAPSTR